jgi:omega-6 fatty acid desaturase (delta-12 desaturase)
MLEQEIKQQLKDWKKIIKRYQQPDSKRAWWQVVNTFGPFLALWVLMYFSLEWSYWITLGLGLVNGFLLARIFIIQHDCGHHSFLESKGWNDAIGNFCSFFSTIPYKYWSKIHNYHHGHSGQLEEEPREIGDVPFLTVEEYRNLSRWGRFKYRLFRTPVVLFIVTPIVYLSGPMRWPTIKVPVVRSAHVALFLNNLWIGLVYSGLIYLLGWEFLWVQVPIIIFFGTIAFWFFYVQHQHEETYKKWKDEWDYLVAAVSGSTYYKLPKVFNWLTGNIGFHHIHHLSSLIPNYNLPRCAKENPILQKYVTTVTFKESLACMFNKLWDEQQERMISFREYYRLERSGVFG